jgi:hypothetical protein
MVFLNDANRRLTTPADAKRLQITWKIGQTKIVETPAAESLASVVSKRQTAGDVDALLCDVRGSADQKTDSTVGGRAADSGEVIRKQVTQSCSVFSFSPTSAFV